MESKSLQRNDTQQTDKNIYSLAILRETAVFLKKKLGVQWICIVLHGCIICQYISSYSDIYILR